MRLFKNRAFLPAIAASLLMILPSIAVAQMAWVKNFDDALKQAARENKFIVLDISASW